MIGQKPQNIKLSSDPTKQLYVDGFAGGLNTLTSPQHIQDNECSILLNAVISEDGVISRRQGSAAYDSAVDDTRVVGLGKYTTYDSSGVATRYLLKIDNSGHLRKLNLTTKVWSTITGFTYTTGKNTEFIQGLNSTRGPVCYILNGVDNLTYTDGSTIYTYSNTTDPSGGLTVAAQATTGSSSYSYSYTLVTRSGETLPVTNVTISNGNATLDATNYNLLTITRSTDANVTGYNVYGRTGGAGGLNYFMKFVPQTASGDPTYEDTGVDTPNPSVGTPTYNTTQGKILSMGIVYHDSLIGAGDPQNPSAVWYSAGQDKFDSFELVYGGGFELVDIEDGDIVTALVSYKDEIVIFKNRSSWLMDFTTISNIPVAELKLVNPQIGCSSPRSARVVVNDVYYMGPNGQIFTLGYQQGYYGAGGVADLLRTNQVSIKITPTLATINPNNINTSAALYSPANYKYIVAYADGSSTVNNKVVVYDTRYNAWAQWDNVTINCLLSFIDSGNNEIVLYGDDATGRVVQLFTSSSDQGTAFTFRMRTKDFNANAFHLMKTWVWPTIHFRNISGAVKTTLTADGANTAYSAIVTSTTSFTGWSFDRWANILWGTTTGSSASATSADAPRQVNTRFDSRSLMFLFENTSTSDQITILGIQSRYILRVQRRLGSEFILN